jgi:exopolysaccharide biosynthesis WecB/TagA/CpsF family protein
MKLPIQKTEQLITENDNQIERKYYSTKNCTEKKNVQNSLFNITIWNGTMSKAVDWITARAVSGANTQIGFVNANNLNIAFRDSVLTKHYQACDRIFADGSGVSLAAKIAWPKEKTIKDNINGTDLFPALCKELEKEGMGIYLLGASKGVARRVAINLNQTNPTLKICGYHDGYLRDELTNRRVIKDINQSTASVLLVAMGTPLQETWLDRNGNDISVPVKMSVGGLFDFYSGRVSRAPSWIRNIGCEWMWRLAIEPKRMWKRYILGNPLFLYRVVKEAISRRLNTCKNKSQKDQSLDQFTSASLKRVFDVVISSVGLVLFSPVLFAIALCIVLESGGSPMYTQTRVGKSGRLFRFWKFRSMVKSAHQIKKTLMGNNDSAGGVLFKIRKDPRVTRFGQFLRHYSLDELPQLWNVLIGDMSLVGPRPALQEEVSLYSELDRERLQVLPGITCFWQISGRSDLSFNQQISLDRMYIRKQSFLTDLKILVFTLPAVISGKGAY